MLALIGSIELIRYFFEKIRAKPGLSINNKSFINIFLKRDFILEIYINFKIVYILYNSWNYKASNYLNLYRALNNNKKTSNFFFFLVD